MQAKSKANLRKAVFYRYFGKFHVRTRRSTVIILLLKVTGRINKKNAILPLSQNELYMLNPKKEKFDFFASFLWVHFVTLVRVC